MFSGRGLGLPPWRHRVPTRCSLRIRTTPHRLLPLPGLSGGRQAAIDGMVETADFKVFPFVEEACMVIWQLHSSCGARVLTLSHPVDIFGRQKQVHMKRASAQNSTGSLGIHGFGEPLPLLWSHSRDFVQVCSYGKRLDWCALSLVLAALGVRLLLRLPVTCGSVRFRFVLCAHALALVTPRR